MFLQFGEVWGGGNAQLLQGSCCSWLALNQTYQHEASILHSATQKTSGATDSPNYNTHGPVQVMGEIPMTPFSNKK